MNSGLFLSEDFEKLNVVQRLRQIESHINSIPEIPASEVQYLNEMIRLIIDEILSLRNDSKCHQLRMSEALPNARIEIGKCAVLKKISIVTSIAN